MQFGIQYAYSRCFFFQAEDGIRDLVRSRGLGDVYKRQEDLMARGVGELHHLVLDTRTVARTTPGDRAAIQRLSLIHI